VEIDQKMKYQNKGKVENAHARRSLSKKKKKPGVPA
jgi:hypothetical protein